jgi:hypothetical protein
MRYLVIIGMFFLSLPGYAQALDKCPSDDRVFSKAEHMPVFKKNVDSLRAFFVGGLPSIGFDNATGSLSLDILVCVSGAAKLSSQINKTDVPVNEQSTKDLIASMPKWKSAMQNGRWVDCYVYLELTLEHGTITRFRYTNNSQ